MLPLAKLLFLSLCLGHASPSNYHYYDRDYGENEPLPSDAASSDSNNYLAGGLPDCTSLNSCHDPFAPAPGVVNSKDPCQIHVDCVELTEIDSTIVPTNAAVLMIRSSFFTNLTYSDMKNYSQLVEMQIEYNDLTYIEPGTFQAQTKLEALVIAGNGLSKIRPGTFRGLGKVKKLKLENDEISTLFKGTFEGLTSLIDLDLSLNLINELNDDVFFGLRSLRSLQLQGNNISFVSPRAFRNLPKLETLNMELNGIKRIPTSSLRALPRLLTLHIGKNPIDRIARSSFKEMKSLTRLYLDGCDIAVIAKRAFHNKKLRTLSLSNNLLNTLPNLGQMPHLIELGLGANPWKCDCGATAMARWLRNNGFANTSVVCAAPDYYNGVEMMSIVDLCQIPTSALPVTRPPYENDTKPTEPGAHSRTTLPLHSFVEVLSPRNESQNSATQSQTDAPDLNLASSPEMKTVHSAHEPFTPDGDYGGIPFSGDDYEIFLVTGKLSSRKLHLTKNNEQLLTEKVDPSVIVAIAVAMTVGLIAILAVALRAICWRSRLHRLNEISNVGTNAKNGEANGKIVNHKCETKKRHPVSRTGKVKGNGMAQQRSQTKPADVSDQPSTNGVTKGHDGNDNYESNAHEL